MFLGGSAVIGLTLLVRGPGWAGTSILLAIAVACLTCGVLLLLLRPNGTVLMAGANWLGIVIISFAIATVRPVMLIPCFYVWPLLVSGTHFSHRHAGRDLVFASVAFAVAIYGFARRGRTRSDLRHGHGSHGRRRAGVLCGTGAYGGASKGTQDARQQPIPSLEP
jgi:hypothetical protein